MSHRKWQQPWILLRAMKENLFHDFHLAAGSWLAIFVIPWLLKASPRSLPSSSDGLPLCGCLSPNSLFYKDTRSYWITAHSNGLILTRLPLERPSVQIRSHSELQQVRIATCEFGGCGESRTRFNPWRWYIERESLSILNLGYASQSPKKLWKVATPRSHPHWFWFNWSGLGSIHENFKAH